MTPHDKKGWKIIESILDLVTIQLLEGGWMDECGESEYFFVHHFDSIHRLDSKAKQIINFNRDNYF